MLQQFAFRSRAQFIDGFVLDLADTFAGQTEFIANIFQTHRMLDIDTEIQADNIALTVGQRTK